MEHQLWKEIVAVLERIDKPPVKPTFTYSCVEIVLVWFWAVLHDRPVSWACDRCNWPIHLQKRRLPSSSTMSRRLRTNEVQKLMQMLEDKQLQTDGSKPLAWMIDGKPLVIGGCSKDRQAGFGRAAGGKATGYKLHSIIGIDGTIAAWRIAPMNKDERVMGRRLVRAAEIQGYLLADGNYDSNPLHEVCSERGELQLISPPRGGLGKQKRRRVQSAGRRRSLELLESPQPEFGHGLLHERDEIERKFGNLTNWGGSLTHLPPWARTHRRVHRWVQAKLIINSIKHPIHTTTYVN